MENNHSDNSILLTIIAIATLLVAIVGATFAFFSTGVDNEAQVMVNAETRSAEAADVFTSIGNPVINLAVSTEQMQQSNGNDNHLVIANSADADGNVLISLKAGSGIATCIYNVVYNPTSEFITTPLVASKEELTNKKEFVLFGNSSIDTNDFEDVDASGPVGSPIILKSGASITDDGSDDIATDETWLFTAKFYNLGTDQSYNANKSFGGTISITDVNCSNEAN